MCKICLEEDTMKYLIILAFTVQLVLTGCGGGLSTSAIVPSTEDSDNTSNIVVTMKTDNSRSAAAKDARYSACGTEDSPGVAPGLDCDGDGGAVRYINASTFKVAIKRMALIKSDGSKVDIIADTGMLASSRVINLSSPVVLSPVTVPKDSYTGVYFEFYYYDIKMLIEGVDREIRIYLSDDNFASEGSLGHHQGDVMMKSLLSGSYAFVSPGLRWMDTLLETTRTVYNITGAGGIDPQTGHRRGLYGDTDLWNSAGFAQGTSQDIFTYTLTSPVAIPVSTLGGAFTVTFDLADTWYFEDYDGDGNFDPCNAGAGNIEACAGTATWSPVFPTPSISLL